jgi:hypothetical protein
VLFFGGVVGLVRFFDCDWYTLQCRPPRYYFFVSALFVLSVEDLRVSVSLAFIFCLSWKRSRFWVYSWNFEAVFRRERTVTELCGAGGSGWLRVCWISLGKVERWLFCCHVNERFVHFVSGCFFPELPCLVLVKRNVHPIQKCSSCLDGTSNSEAWCRMLVSHRLLMCRRSFSDVAARRGNFQHQTSFQQWNKG